MDKIFVILFGHITFIMGNESSVEKQMREYRNSKEFEEYYNKSIINIKSLLEIINSYEEVEYKEKRPVQQLNCEYEETQNKLVAYVWLKLFVLLFFYHVLI